MTPEEVIERLKTIFAFGISNCIADKIARDTTFAALEKQMPKKPIYLGAQFEEEPTCPSCFRTLDEEVDINGCQMCLQRLDWGNEDES